MAWELVHALSPSRAHKQNYRSQAARWNHMWQHDKILCQGFKCISVWGQICSISLTMNRCPAPSAAPAPLSRLWDVIKPRIMFQPGRADLSCLLTPLPSAGHLTLDFQNTWMGRWDNAAFSVALSPWRPGRLHKCMALVPTNGCLQRSLCCDTRHHAHTHTHSQCLYIPVAGCAPLTQVWGRQNNEPL